jgi:hypothetical protein
MKLPKPNLKLILLYYSAFLLTVLIIGGFITAKAVNEVVSTLLLLPVAVFLWISIVPKFRKPKKQ